MIRRVLRQAGRSSRPIASAEPSADPADVLRRYLAGRRTGLGEALAAKAVVLVPGEPRWRDRVAR